MDTATAGPVTELDSLLAQLDDIETSARSLDEDHEHLRLRDTASDAVRDALAPHGGDDLGEDTDVAVLRVAVAAATDALADMAEYYADAPRTTRSSAAWPQDWTSRTLLGV